MLYLSFRVLFVGSSANQLEDLGKNAAFCVNIYIRCEMTPTSVGGEQQISISGGVNLPSDIASGRAHIVRWTMVLRRPKRSVDLQRCASCIA